MGTRQRYQTTSVAPLGSSVQRMTPHRERGGRYLTRCAPRAARAAALERADAAEAAASESASTAARAEGALRDAEQGRVAAALAAAEAQREATALWERVAQAEAAQSGADDAVRQAQV